MTVSVAERDVPRVLPYQSLEYINEAKWRVTLEPEELAGD